jgi:hypothetical protein
MRARRETMMLERDSCDHGFECEACGPANVKYHDAAVHVREWAEAIEELAWTLMELKVDDGRSRRLLNGIEGLSWGIRWKAELDIENETTSHFEDERPKPRLVSPKEETS